MNYSLFGAHVLAGNTLVTLIYNGEHNVLELCKLEYVKDVQVFRQSHRTILDTTDDAHFYYELKYLRKNRFRLRGLNRDDLYVQLVGQTFVGIDPINPEEEVEEPDYTDDDYLEGAL